MLRFVHAGFAKQMICPCNQPKRFHSLSTVYASLADICNQDVRVCELPEVVQLLLQMAFCPNHLVVCKIYV